MVEKKKAFASTLSHRSVEFSFSVCLLCFALTAGKFCILLLSFDVSNSAWSVHI